MARKILLADDSVTAQNMGRKILSDAGYEVITVNNGSAALKRVSESKPDVIVLDVYMPGYSGLEVCQRIKDTRETSRIPVLLTVGKLEPFKQDEARRVRADAFIVKPFEASELLAALHKLEDKVLAAPEGSKHPKESRVTETIERFERFAAEEPKYVDQEAGWKSRLTIPSSEARLPELEPEPEPAAPAPVRSFRDELTTEEAKPASSSAPTPTASVMERPIPTGLPQDITADEIAAIAAAAARIRGGASVEQELEQLDSGKAEPAVEEKAETKAPEPPAKVAEPEKIAVAPPAATPLEVSAPTPEPQPREAPPAPAVEVKPTEPVVAAAPPQETVPAEVSSAKTPRPEPPPTPEPAPVAAAVSSVAPVSEVPAAAVAKVEVPEPAVVPAEKPAPEPVAVAAAAAAGVEGATIAVGPRWVAEEVPLEADEAVLVLEREMQKAYAAFAAAEYAASKPFQPAPVDRNDEPIFATMAPPAIGEPVPVGAKPEPPVEVTKEPEPAKEPVKEPAVVASVVSTAFHEIPHVAEVSKPPAAPFAPVTSPQLEEEKHAVAAFGEPHPSVESTPEPEPVAVASAPAPETKPAETPAPATPATPESRREAELAAATAATWANWKDIRESAAGPALTSQPEAPSAKAKEDLEELKVLKGLKKEETPAATTETEALAAAASADGSAPAPAGDAPELSSIVDNMLAELKPKLMAELAKKLDKKKK